METQVVLKYRGPSVDDGRMDVYEASENMIAFSDFMVAVVKATYGDKAEATAEISGFARGSFATNLLINVGGVAATAFTALTPYQVWTVVKDAFRLWKHLRGSPPPTVSNSNDQTLSVTNNNGQIIQVRTEAMTLVMSEAGAGPVGRFVKRALEREGITSLHIEDEKSESIVEVTNNEAHYFIPVSAESVVSDNTIRMVVSLVSPVFLDGNKWRFHDGASAFAAAILDEAFVAAVNSGERFGKGDLLDVDMRIVQKRTNTKVAVEREVIKVHKHLTPQEQLTLH